MMQNQGGLTIAAQHKPTPSGQVPSTVNEPAHDINAPVRGKRTLGCLPFAHEALAASPTSPNGALQQIGASLNPVLGSRDRKSRDSKKADLHRRHLAATSGIKRGASQPRSCISWDWYACGQEYSVGEEKKDGELHNETGFTG